MKSRMIPAVLPMIGVLVVAYGSVPLFSSVDSSARAAICCADSNGCPEGSACSVGSDRCSDEAEGYCVAIPPGE